MVVKILIVNISRIRFIHICNMNDINNTYMDIRMALPLSYPIYILLISFMLQIRMNLMVLMLMMSILAGGGPWIVLYIPWKRRRRRRTRRRKRPDLT